MQDIPEITEQFKVMISLSEFEIFIFSDGSKMELPILMCFWNNLDKK